MAPFATAHGVPTKATASSRSSASTTEKPTSGAERGRASRLPSGKPGTGTFLPVPCVTGSDTPESSNRQLSLALASGGSHDEGAVTRLQGHACHMGKGQDRRKR